MKPLEISCTYSNAQHINCAAQKGEPCQWMHEDDFHPERIESAAAMEQNADPVSVESFERAVLSTGLV